MSLAERFLASINPAAPTIFCSCQVGSDGETRIDAGHKEDALASRQSLKPH